MLELRDVWKTYKMGSNEFIALKGIDASFKSGELVAIVGESGSGKSTLMNLIGGLDSDFTGEILYEGKNIRKYNEQELVDYRKKNIGFIFQSFNLIPHLSILDNVTLAMTLSNKSKDIREKRAIELLSSVGLEEQLHKKPDQISGGQKQRVAIARALANNPDIIIADEPTGALDAETTDIVLDIIKKIAKQGKLVIMVTHSEKVAAEASRIVRIDNGSLIEDLQKTNVALPIVDKLILPEGEGKKDNLKFLSAVKLSFLNMKEKFSRNLLVACGSSIGIMSVILMLGLGAGMKDFFNTMMNQNVNPNVVEVNMPSEEAKEEKQKDALGASSDVGFQMLGMASNEQSFKQKDIDKLAKIKNVDSYQKGFTMMSIGTNTITYQDKKVAFMGFLTVSNSLNKAKVLKGTLPKSDEVMITTSLDSKFKKSLVGKKVKMSLYINEKTMEKEFKVSGVYDTSAGDGSGMPTAFLGYQQFVDLGKEHDVEIKPNVVYLHTKNQENTSEIKKEVKRLGYTGSVSESMISMFTEIIDVSGYALVAVAAISLIVSAVMILVVLNISVVERTKEIGVLKALGARKKDVRRIFTSEALLIGLASGMIGVSVAYVIQLTLNFFAKKAFDVSIILISPAFALFGLVISVLISMIASILPANKAAKLDPVESLRRE